MRGGVRFVFPSIGRQANGSQGFRLLDANGDSGKPLATERAGCLAFVRHAKGGRGSHTELQARLRPHLPWLGAPPRGRQRGSAPLARPDGCTDAVRPFLLCKRRQTHKEARLPDRHRASQPPSRHQERPPTPERDTATRLVSSPPTDPVVLVGIALADSAAP